MPCTTLAVGLQGEVVLDMLHEVSPGVEAAPGHQLRAVLPADGGGRVPVQQEYYLLRLMCILRESSLTHLLTCPPRPPPRAWSGSSRRAAAPSPADTRP